MSNSTLPSLRFPSISGYSVRADFNGGALSSDFGPIILRGVDQQISLTQRLAEAFEDKRHPGYIQHELQTLMAQRIYQIACAYEDANDANSLRTDPMFKLGLGRAPLDEGNALASAPTFSRLENAASSKDIYRIARAFVDQFIASYVDAPPIIILDMDHSEDPTHGQQEFSFYNAHYGSHCYLPLFLFEGFSGKFITAALRPGKRPQGVENAMILKRVLKRLREVWPETRIILRGDSHFCNPELMTLTLDDPYTDFVFGVGSNRKLPTIAAPYLEANRAAFEQRCAYARREELPEIPYLRTYHSVDYVAGRWPQACHVVLKAEVMMKGDNPRFIVSSLQHADPEYLYRELYCARGQDENYIKAIKNDLFADRTSDHRFLANHLRLFFSCAAYVLHHTLRTETLAHTELAKAQPATVISKLFKLAVRVVQYKDRIKLQLPDACSVKGLLHRLTEILYLARSSP